MALETAPQTPLARRPDNVVLEASAPTLPWPPAAAMPIAASTGDQPPPPPSSASTLPLTMPLAGSSARVVNSLQERSPYPLDDAAPPPPTPGQAPQQRSPLPPRSRTPVAPEELAPPRSADRSDFYNKQECPSTRVIDVLHGRSLAAIRLDTTPVFDPGHDEPGKRDDAMQSQLAASPTRAWRNTQGELLAQGRMVDYQWGKVVVETERGQRVPLKYVELGDDERCFVTGWWGVPATLALRGKPYEFRSWTPSTFAWNASAACFNPLYFEDVQLERYGHTIGLAQPVLSGAHFFAHIALLPYQMGIHPPNECSYPLGHYRVGNCAPRLLPPVPISLRGGLLEAGGVLGAIYALP